MKDKITLEINGVSKEFDLLFSFDNEELNRTYVGYTDNSTIDGQTKIYAGYTDYLSDIKSIKPVTNEAEVEMFTSVLNEIFNGSNYEVVTDAK